ncbi:MAG: group II intron reverse transcriptase/maturase [Bacteroidota bacterium]
MLDGGPVRSSEEASVMEVERRDGVVLSVLSSPPSVIGSRSEDVLARVIPIGKQMVWQAYKKVKRKGGGGGIDGESMQEFDEEKSDNLYRIWNRLSSGSYQAPPVLEVKIPKGSGQTRSLGIPTVGDRIAQEVIRSYLSPRLESEFVSNSYGYRPGRSAHEALASVRENVQRYDWVIDLDISNFFTEVSHDLMLRALSRHLEVEETWVGMYIQRWLSAPIFKEDGSWCYHEGLGTPQGGVISPLLSNLYLHYALDKWLGTTYPGQRYTRYADDVIIHCSSLEEAEEILSSIRERLSACHLRLNESKTRIVYCKDRRRRGSHPHVYFDFLGFRFQPRTSCVKYGRLVLLFDCGISPGSISRITQWFSHKAARNWAGRELSEIAQFFNAKIRGWLQYYGAFRRHLLWRIFRRFHRRLVKWAINRYKRFGRSKRRAAKWIRRLIKSRPETFVHWRTEFSRA